MNDSRRKRISVLEQNKIAVDLLAFFKSVLRLTFNAKTFVSERDSLKASFYTRCKRERAMEVWKCNKCGNTISVEAPPETCPSCAAHCEFVNVTCYTPDCGGPGSGNVNGKVFQESYKGLK